jgi:hypothetical protein
VSCAGGGGVQVADDRLTVETAKLAGVEPKAYQRAAVLAALREEQQPAAAEIGPS